MPMDRAVPRILLIAVSTEAAFKSGIFCLAMSSTCLAVTLPTLSLFGVPDPLAMPAARFNRIDAGGVLVMKVNERSLYTDTTTGMISPSISFWLVLALNCLQNSMMLIWCWPSAGPTGGAGVALPAAICSFTEPVAFFAIISALFPETRNRKRLLGHLLHLVELQFYRGRAPEDRHHHLQRLAVFVHVIHHAGERGKGALGDAHRLVLFKLDLELGLVLGLAHAVHDVLHFLFRKRGWLLPRTHESGHPGRGFHHMPHMVIHVHLDQHVAGIEHALHRVLLAAAHFRHRFGGNQ